MRLGRAGLALMTSVPVFVTVVGSSAAARDTFAPEDKTSVHECLKSTRAQSKPARNCIGAASRICEEKPGMESTAGMRDCYLRESAVWEELLNERYRALLGELSKKGAEKLRDIQRVWITWREEKCQLPYLLFEGGTMAIPASAYCFMETTAERALELDEAASTTGAQ
jgi:uncharacterized protein YecT (DUF1311 family)